MSFETPAVKYGATLLLAAVILFPLFSGCQQYGSVSLSACQVATALYSICNQAGRKTSVCRGTEDCRTDVIRRTVRKRIRLVARHRESGPSGRMAGSEGRCTYDVE